MATHSSILARKIPWTEEPGELQSMGSQESDTTEQLSLFTFRWHSGKEPSCQCRRHKRHRFNQEDPLEEEMATHSSILASKILWTEEPGRLHSMGSQELDKTVCAHKYKHTHTVHGFIKYRS